MRNVKHPVVAVLLVAAAALPACREKKAPPAEPPPVPVKVATVLQKDVPIYIEAIGQTRGSTEIEVRARVEGFIQTVDFKEGSQVRKGQLLYTIDPSPFEAQLAQSKGTLAAAQADLARARQDVARYKPLADENAIPRQTYETAVAVESANQGAVAAAQASVQKAQVDLGYTRVLAPEAGLIGKTEVYPGTLVGRGQSTLLTHISQIRSIHVRFTLPEKDYLYYARRSERMRGDISAGQAPLELILADGTALPDKGRIVFADRNVDPTTGTIMLEAAFPNPGELVRPGQYARVRAAVETKKGAILVPQRAVSEMQGIYSVAIVKADDTIETRMVTPGQRVGSLWVIDSGLKAGERIVVEGVQKVRPGMKVKPEIVTIQEAPAASPAAVPTADAGETKGAEG